MKISIIVAASTNNVIGNSGGLPWRLPEDLKRFKQITMGKPMIMGRATWDSIGRPCPDDRTSLLPGDRDLLQRVAMLQAVRSRLWKWLAMLTRS